MNSKQKSINKDKLRTRVMVFSIIGLIFLSIPIIFSTVNFGVSWDIARPLMLSTQL